MPQFEGISNHLKDNMLDLSGCNMDSQNITTVISAVENYPEIIKIEFIDLSNNQLGDDGAKIIATFLSSNNTVKSLSLKRNNIGCQGAYMIADSLYRKQIQTLLSLDLSDNVIRDDGIITLAQILTAANCKLQSIDLSFNPFFGKESYVALAESIMENRTLLNLKTDRYQYQELFNSILKSDRQNNSVFLEAVKLGNLSLVIFLVERGEDIEQENNEGKTPLCLAAELGHEEIVDFLITEGSEKHHQTSKNDTPFTLAKKNNHDRVLARLIKAASCPSWLNNCLIDLKKGIVKLDLSSNYYLPINPIHNGHINVLVKPLASNQTVTSLNLANNQISENGAKLLLKMLESNTTLTSINLSNNKIKYMYYNNNISQKTLKAIEEKLSRNSLLQGFDLSQKLDQMNLNNCNLSTPTAVSIETDKNLTNNDIYKNNPDNNNDNQLVRASARPTANPTTLSQSFIAKSGSSTKSANTSMPLENDEDSQQQEPLNQIPGNHL